MTARRSAGIPREGTPPAEPPRADTALSSGDTTLSSGDTARTALVAAAVAFPVAAVTIATAAVVGADTSLADPFVLATGAAAASAAAIAAAVAAWRILVRHHRRLQGAAADRHAATDHDLDDERRQRAVRRELDRALDMAPTEQAAVEIITESLSRLFPGRPMELHLVDPIDPVLTLALATGDFTPRPGRRLSPWDSRAARSNTTLVYETTDRLDTCNHLKSRVDEPVSAVAVPLNAMGRLFGVLYGLGAVDETPDPGDVAFLEDLASSMAARLALLRAASGAGGAADDVDRLTGLPDRTAMQGRVLRMLQERTPFTVAVADIDHFAQINETEGREAGDRALQLLAQVARRTVRPGDVIGRIGGDEILFVLPRTPAADATRALERLREELVLAQSTTSDPMFTLSIGVISSEAGGTIEEILQRAAAALGHAKTQGGNRVVVAQPTRQAPPAS